MSTSAPGGQGPDTPPAETPPEPSPGPAASPASLPRYDTAQLERRREELAAQVAELHWDLGGLAYEMAVRDHFRNDLLMSRAAQLQERDAELAEVERKLGYERSLGAGPGSEEARKAWSRVLPPAQISALLLVAFLGFGVAMGAVAKGSGARRVRPREVLVAQAPAVTPTATSTTKSSPPASEPEATPSPSGEESESSTPTTTSTPSSSKSATKSPSGSSSPSGGEGSSGGGEEAASPKKLPGVKHVFVVMLDDQPYATAFGPASPAHYLTGTLEHQGALLVRYYAVAHEQLANAIALVSGQGPTPQTAQNCPTYEDLTPGTAGDEGQTLGHGCVYPSATQTLAGQLTAKHLKWRAYLEGMDEPGAGAGSAYGACGHPAPGAPDPTSAPTPPAGQAYATWRNPFVYFHSLIDSSACANNDVGLNKLKSDLASAKSTPSFAYIVPDRCHDGNATPCAPGAPAGMGAADGWLKKVVPEITASKAYKENGLLVLTVDEAPSSGEYEDSSSCCGQPKFPNMPAPAGGIGPPGGGQVGALLLSPFIKGGATVQDTYNHFSLLRSVEDLFKLGHLGYAGGKEVSSFSPALFTKSQ
jgi:phosphatidylinositol-3-phosphatase